MPFWLRFIIFWIILILPQNSLSFSIEKIIPVFSDKQVLISLYYGEFPFQELVLALKSQRYPIVIEYEFEVYEKRFLRDLLIYKERFFQTLFYDPEKNLYYLENKSGTKTFEKAEIAVKSIACLDSYPLNFYSLTSKNYLKIKVFLNYFTHLSEELKFNFKVRKKTLRTEKEYNF